MTSLKEWILSDIENTKMMKKALHTLTIKTLPIKRIFPRKHFEYKKKKQHWQYFLINWQFFISEVYGTWG